MNQINDLRAKLSSEANVQVVDSVDGAVAALSRNPAAFVIPDNTLAEGSYDRIRTEVARYVHNGGRLITALDQVTAGLGGCGHWTSDFANIPPVGQGRRQSVMSVSASCCKHMVG